MAENGKKIDKIVENKRHPRLSKTLPKWVPLAYLGKFRQIMLKTKNTLFCCNVSQNRRYWEIEWRAKI
jgi:hypothetical protein